MASPGVMISRELQVTLQLAMTEARIGATSTSAWSICCTRCSMTSPPATSCRTCGADLDALRSKLHGYLDEQVERMPQGRDCHAALCDRRAAGAAARGAARAVGGSQRNQRVGNVLVAMFHETESHALYLSCRSRASRAST